MVFHAAAHKHLPVLERHPCEGVKTNVRGTQALVEAAQHVGAERFILISTDKAADPASVLGATKRLAEMVVQANVAGGSRTSLGSVRFGNVLGSRGSLLPTLSAQLRRDERVTITHPDVTRYFMTIEEAVGLVLVAASMAEYGETFVLDMGEPVRIVDLVASYAAHARNRGLRDRVHRAPAGGEAARVPGEQPRALHSRPPTTGSGRTRPRPVPPEFGLQLARLYRCGAPQRRRRDATCLRSAIPEYEPATARLIPFARHDDLELATEADAVADARRHRWRTGPRPVEPQPAATLEPDPR